MNDLAKRLRDGVRLRFNKVPIKDFVTMCQQAADALEAQAKRIAELEAQLADSNEALQILGLKLAHAEADIARLWVFRTAFEHIEAHITLEPDGVAWMPLNEWQGHAAIDAAMSHSASAVVGMYPLSASIYRDCQYNSFHL